MTHLQPTNRQIATSYAAVLLMLILGASLHMMTPVITVLFSYFVLSKLNFWHKRWLALVLFLVVVAAIFSGFVVFLKKALVALPDIVSTTIPVVVKFADKHGIDLPFSDMDSLKDTVMEGVRDTLGYLGSFARIATKEFVFLIVGVVIACGIFLSHERSAHTASQLSSEPDNLYSFYSALIIERFRAFYRSFEVVMSAQLLISAVNTLLTALFVLGCSIRYAGVVIPMTFLCGLLPVVGNLISNSLIVCLAFTKSPQMAGWALLFLVAVHKLEYFLNSKIVGSRIRHPMWLMLLALILGERMMGIPGIILAPVILHYVKVEASRFPVQNRIVAPPEEALDGLRKHPQLAKGEVVSTPQ